MTPEQLDIYEVGIRQERDRIRALIIEEILKTNGTSVGKRLALILAVLLHKIEPAKSPYTAEQARGKGMTLDNIKRPLRGSEGLL